MSELLNLNILNLKKISPNQFWFRIRTDFLIA